MVFYALAAADARFVIDLYATREAAEAALAEVIVDEPSIEALLSIMAVAFSSEDMHACLN